MADHATSNDNIDSAIGPVGDSPAVAVAANDATDPTATPTQQLAQHQQQPSSSAGRKRSAEESETDLPASDAAVATAAEVAAAAAAAAAAMVHEAGADAAAAAAVATASPPPAKKQAVEDAVAVTVPAPLEHQHVHHVPAGMAPPPPAAIGAAPPSVAVAPPPPPPMAPMPMPSAPVVPIPTPMAAATTPTPTPTPASGGGSGSGSGSGKAYKGLRHFSMMVCKKVEEKGTTTYNEVADELVHQVVQERRMNDLSGRGCDEKNIRRRVYDALNVLMAMDIITKNKKAISWKGLPTSAHQDLDMLRRERDFRRQEVERKRESLRELLVQQVCFRNLVEHNQRRELHDQQRQSEHHHGGAGAVGQQKIPLPFIVVNTHSSAVIQCNMSRDLTDVMFDFSMPFEINDDNTILKRLGMHRTTLQVLREMLPDELLKYCQQHGLLNSILGTAPVEAPISS